MKRATRLLYQIAPSAVGGETTTDLGLGRRVKLHLDKTCGGWEEKVAISSSGQVHLVPHPPEEEPVTESSSAVPEMVEKVGKEIGIGVTTFVWERLSQGTSGTSPRVQGWKWKGLVDIVIHQGLFPPVYPLDVPKSESLDTALALNLAVAVVGVAQAQVSDGAVSPGSSLLGEWELGELEWATRVLSGMAGVLYGVTVEAGLGLCYALSVEASTSPVFGPGSLWGALVARWKRWSPLGSRRRSAFHLLNVVHQISVLKTRVSILAHNVLSRSRPWGLSQAEFVQAPAALGRALLDLLAYHAAASQAFASDHTDATSTRAEVVMHAIFASIVEDDPAWFLVNGLVSSAQLSTLRSLLFVLKPQL